MNTYTAMAEIWVKFETQVEVEAHTSEEAQDIMTDALEVCEYARLGAPASVEYWDHMETHDIGLTNLTCLDDEVTDMTKEEMKAWNRAMGPA